MIFADVPSCSSMFLVALVMWVVVAYQIRATARKAANNVKQAAYYAAAHPHQTSILYHFFRGVFGR